MKSLRRKNQLNSYFWIFLLSGLSIQVVAFFLAKYVVTSETPTTWLSLLSGLFGISAVVLCSHGNIWFYLFGFIQTVTAGIICYMNGLYANFGLNIFYLITEFYGLWVWYHRLQTNSNEVQTRSLSHKALLVLGTLTIIISIAVGALMKHFTNDAQPYLDAFSTVPAIAAQLLMILAFSEHWYIWLAIDVLQVVLWARAGDWCMTAQYAFWCINATYGIINWKKLNGAPQK